MERIYTQDYLAKEPKAIALRVAPIRARAPDRGPARGKPEGGARRGAGRARERHGRSRAPPGPDRGGKRGSGAIHGALQRIQVAAGRPDRAREDLPGSDAEAGETRGERTRSHAGGQAYRGGEHAARTMVVRSIGGTRASRPAASLVLALLAMWLVELFNRTEPQPAVVVVRPQMSGMSYDGQGRRPAAARFTASRSLGGAAVARRATEAAARARARRRGGAPSGIGRARPAWLFSFCSAASRRRRRSRREPAMSISSAGSSASPGRRRGKSSSAMRCARSSWRGRQTNPRTRWSANRPDRRRERASTRRSCARRTTRDSRILPTSMRLACGTPMSRTSSVRASASPISRRSSASCRHSFSARTRATRRLALGFRAGESKRAIRELARTSQADSRASMRLEPGARISRSVAELHLHDAALAPRRRRGFGELERLEAVVDRRAQPSPCPRAPRRSAPSRSRTPRGSARGRNAAAGRG